VSSLEVHIGPSAISYFMSKIKLFCPCVLALLHECTTAFEQIVCYGAVRSAILATARLLVLLLWRSLVTGGEDDEMSHTWHNFIHLLPFTKWW